MSLMDKLLKASTVKLTAPLLDSKVFGKKEMVQTPVPMVNVALSGRIDGGLQPGLTMLAGPSKHFKSAFALLMAAAYQKKYDDAIILFYDSEFGTPQAYFEAFGVDMSRVIHTPITNIEELKFDIVQQLEAIEKKDHVIVVVDSIGNLASKKEVDDAVDGKSVADMTRAKQLKSVFRIVTPHLNLKDIPMIVVNHIYMEQGLYPKAIVSGGCLEENTMIKTVNGPVAVQDIRPGMIVETMVGPREVTRAWTPDTLADGEPECYKITFEDGSSVVCSDAHEFLVNGNWVEARDLKVGDDCAVLN